MLRWWFTLKYDAVVATADRDAFEIRGPGVQVLSENELLTQSGRTGSHRQSEPHEPGIRPAIHPALRRTGQKYPVYADLQNVFDLALVSALVNSEHLADRVDWHMTCFGDADQYQPALGASPESVDTVINHRVVNGKHVVVGVSGGVRVQPWSLVSHETIKADTYGGLKAQRAQSKAAANLPLEAWWWD